MDSCRNRARMPKRRTRLSRSFVSLAILALIATTWTGNGWRDDQLSLFDTDSRPGSAETEPQQKAQRRIKPPAVASANASARLAPLAALFLQLELARGQGDAVKKPTKSLTDDPR